MHVCVNVSFPIDDFGKTSRKKRSAREDQFFSPFFYWRRGGEVMRGERRTDRGESERARARGKWRSLDNTRESDFSLYMYSGNCAGARATGVFSSARLRNKGGRGCFLGVFRLGFGGWGFDRLEHMWK